MPGRDHGEGDGEWEELRTQDLEEALSLKTPGPVPAWKNVALRTVAFPQPCWETGSQKVAFRGWNDAVRVEVVDDATVERARGPSAEVAARIAAPDLHRSIDVGRPRPFDLEKPRPPLGPRRRPAHRGERRAPT